MLNASKAGASTPACELVESPFRPVVGSIALLPVLVAGFPAPPPFSLGVDFRGEGVLELQGDEVHEEDLGGQEEAGGAGKPQRAAEEAHGAAPVHWRVGDVERETRHDLVEQDAKVVAQVGARQAQRPHGRQDEYVAEREQAAGQDGHQRVLGQKGGRGLIAEGALVSTTQGGDVSRHAWAGPH